MGGCANNRERDEEKVSEDRGRREREDRSSMRVKEMGERAKNR